MRPRLRREPRIVDDSRERFAAAPLEDFIPTLAYRLARERLRALARPDAL